jgi:hypothetical protein
VNLTIPRIGLVKLEVGLLLILISITEGLEAAEIVEAVVTTSVKDT